MKATWGYCISALLLMSVCFFSVVLWILLMEQYSFVPWLRRWGYGFMIVSNKAIISFKHFFFFLWDDMNLSCWSLLCGRNIRRLLCNIDIVKTWQWLELLNEWVVFDKPASFFTDMQGWICDANTLNNFIELYEVKWSDDGGRLQVSSC